MKNYLKPENRPNNIQSLIDYNFHQSNNDNISNYRTKKIYKGQDNYNMFLVSENYLLLQYLINKQQDQKEFCILEVGASNFQFATNKAKFINMQIEKGILLKDINVNLISIRSENNPFPTPTKDGNCQLWELGGFKIENLIEEFQSRNLQIGTLLGNVNTKFDLIVSYKTMKYLIDPLGTFIQMHDILKIGGIMLTDNFLFKIKNYNLNHFDDTGIFLSYLQDAGDNILIRINPDNKTYLHMAIEKHNEHFTLPFVYDNSRHSYCKLTHEPLRNNGYKLIKQITNQQAWQDNRNFAGSEILFKQLTQALLLEETDKLTKYRETLNLLNTPQYLSILKKQYDKDPFVDTINFNEYVKEEQEHSERAVSRLEKTITSLSDPNCQNFNFGYLDYQYVSNNDNSSQLSGEELSYI